jgi:hypothetical protein
MYGAPQAAFGAALRDPTEDTLIMWKNPSANLLDSKPNGDGKKQK